MRVVERVALIPHAGQTLDRRAKQFELTSALVVADHAESSQAVVRRRHELAAWFFLRQRDRQKAPQIQLIMGRESINRCDVDPRTTAIAMPVRVRELCLKPKARLQGNAGVEGAQSVFDQRELCSGGGHHPRRPAVPTVVAI